MKLNAKYRRIKFINEARTREKYGDPETLRRDLGSHKLVGVSHSAATYWGKVYPSGKSTGTTQKLVRAED